MKNYDHKTVKIKNGFEIPKLGMGTWQLNGSECVESVKHAIDIGYRAIDTAQVYENEEEVGQALKECRVPREEICLTSKVWRDNLSKKDVIKTTEESLKRLKTDYIDLMLIHWPNDDYNLEETMEALAELKGNNKLKEFGVSNFPTSYLEKAQKKQSDFICNQVEYHPYLDQSPVLNWLTKHNKFLIAYSPLARGKVFEDDKIKKIANKHQVDCAQVVLAWLCRQDSVVAIPKSSSREHLKSNWESQNMVLDDEDVQMIDDLQSSKGRMIDPEWAPQWD
jgi:2,5-diketo-D-gluconate reductase B